MHKQISGIINPESVLFAVVVAYRSCLISSIPINGGRTLNREIVVCPRISKMEQRRMRCVPRRRRRHGNVAMQFQNQIGDCDIWANTARSYEKWLAAFWQDKVSAVFERNNGGLHTHRVITGGSSRTCNDAPLRKGCWIILQHPGSATVADTTTKCICYSKRASPHVTATAAVASSCVVHGPHC